MSTATYQSPVDSYQCMCEASPSFSFVQIILYRCRQTFRAEESDEEFFEKKKIPKKKEFSNEEFFIGKK